tara:strand:- start:6 stop:1307 length:1302 start_codon:yes stop_codon:yes gene_type:complete
MGFTTGITSSTGIGTPHYYIDSGGNKWDAHTWVNFHFDSSGSMNDIITPLTNAMTGAYFSSGSAAAGNGVKSTTSLRAELQDLYATGGIEGAPDYNTNNNTNGKNAYDLRVNSRSINDERWLTWSDSHQTSGGSQTWNNLGNNNTVNNIIQVFVINESKGGFPNNRRGAGYYSTGWAEPFTGTLTKTVQATTTSSTTVELDNVTGLVKESDNNDGVVSEPFAEHMKLTAVSAGSLSGTPTITNISSNTVTLSSAQSFAAGTQLTFSMTSFGFNSTNGSFHYSSPDNHSTYATDIVTARNTLGLGSGIKDILTNSGQKPSITYIVIDAGTGTNTRVSALNNVGNGVVGNAHNGPGGLNASQRHVQEGIIEGKLTFHATRTDGNNRSLNDFSDITSWNDKSNMLHLVALTNKSGETSQSYWKDQLRAALQLNVSF